MGSLVKSLKSRDDAGDAVSYFSDTTLPVRLCQNFVFYSHCAVGSFTYFYVVHLLHSYLKGLY